MPDNVKGSLVWCNPSYSKNVDQEKLFLRWKKWQQVFMPMGMIQQRGKIQQEKGELLE